MRAWRATGEPAARARQVEVVMRVGEALDRHTRSVGLRAGLRATRGPARAAGMGSPQTFLESGCYAFGAMRGAHEFLATIGARETALAMRLFEPSAVAGATGLLAPDDVLAQLP